MTFWERPTPALADREVLGQAPAILPAPPRPIVLGLAASGVAAPPARRLPTKGGTRPGDRTHPVRRPPMRTAAPREASAIRGNK
jgi:hypothetical protein